MKTTPMNSYSTAMASPASSVSVSASQVSSHLIRVRFNFRAAQINFSPLKSPKSITRLLFSVPNGIGIGTNTSRTRRSVKPFFQPVMEWQDCTVKMEVDVPASVAYNCYSDREALSQWMPFISSVKIVEDKPDLSRWTLKYEAFGRDIEFSWLARNLQPIVNQKIHWRSLEGLPNRGAVRFFPKGPSSCLVELTVSYEVPQLLTPFASALQPFLKSLLLQGLESFSTFAKSYQPNPTN